MLRIGYQGMENSNSERAALIMMQKKNISDFQLVPLISSKNVIGALKRGEVDYGVVAIKNSTAGIVNETLEAIKNEHLEHVCTEILDINHSLFVLENTVRAVDIKKIYSHEQALMQCKDNIMKFFPNAQTVPIEDTAVGAKYLSEGKYDHESAVLCSLEAGNNYDLYCLDSALQDKKDNRTEFRLFKNYESSKKKAKFKDLISYGIVNEKGLGNLTKFVIVAAIFLAFYLRDYFEWGNLDASLTIGASLATFILFLTSNKLRTTLQYRKVIGYWKYYAIPESSNHNVDQRFETPRVVKIEEIDGELIFRGWLCDNENMLLFESSRVMISSFGKRDGRLVYWYLTPNQTARDFNLNGIVTLKWETLHSADRVNKMSGWYMGKTTKDIGVMDYQRISEEEFNALRSSDYL